MTTPTTYQKTPLIRCDFDAQTSTAVMESLYMSNVVEIHIFSLASQKLASISYRIKGSLDLGPFPREPGEHKGVIFLHN